VLAVACLETSSIASQQHSPHKVVPSFAGDVRPMVTKYCVTCHSGANAPAGLDLAKLSDPSSLTNNMDAWQKVVTRLNAGDMPPAGSPAPSPAVKKKVADYLQDALNAQCKLSDPGRVTLRRLNREEYDNTVRDLIGIDLRPADDFPSDDVGYGFDNIGDVLSMSPLLMEKYISAAEKIARAAIVVPGVHTRHYDATEFSDAAGASPTEDGGRLFLTNATINRVIDLPVGGRYRLRTLAAGDLAGPELPKMLITVDGQPAGTLEVRVQRPKTDTYEAPISIDSGKHVLGIGFTNDYYNTNNKPGDIDRNLWMKSVDLVGPLDTNPSLPETHLRIIPRHPGPNSIDSEARSDLSRFASRAYRHPVQPQELDLLCDVFQAAFKESHNFESAMRVGVEAVLVSPEFLFRLEMDPQGTPGKVRSLDDFELASRLSYFLWSSMPDDELSELASEGKLHRPAILNAQVMRMIRDPKATALADNFAGQWLELRKLAIVFPNPKQFPGVDNGMKKDMATETKMFFNDILQSNLPITDFIDSNFTFLNERLANLYGIPGVSGKEFQRVEVQEPRGGVLTQASVLTVTSNPTRTSPTKRGKWVLEQILGTPPPPPPPGVGVISDEQHRISGATLRQLMEEHRKNPSCAVCHSKMDPIGFGLDNFDAVGRWRTKDGNFDLDTTGVLPDGRSFKGPVDLKQILLADKPKFARSLAEKLLTYGLGRGLDATDRCALDGIVKRTEASGYKFDSLIVAVIDSDPFTKRKGDMVSK
jgi:hypothetical protein